MNQRFRFLLWIIGSLSACSPPPAPPSADRLGEALGGSAEAGYAQALEPRPLHFPADHGAHPEFRNEWWYLTGNLSTEDGRRFGYQFTLFRIALSPQLPVRTSAWASRQVWMGHAAITDVSQRQHHSAERFARGALDLAGTHSVPLRVWLEDWELSLPAAGGPWQLRFATEAFSLELELTDLKPPLAQGDRGLSRKSAQPGNASYYYSIPRLASRGTLRIGEATHGVSGLSWLDREWSTSALGPNQAGWDWFAIQFEDGRDLMYYRLRQTDGSIDAHSGGSLSLGKHHSQRLGASDLELTPTDWWQAPSGSRYPIAWELRLSATGERWSIRTPVRNQWMDLRVKYWEGAIVVTDPDTDRILGRGYLELTGY